MVTLVHRVLRSSTHLAETGEGVSNAVGPGRFWSSSRGCSPVVGSYNAAQETGGGSYEDIEKSVGQEAATRGG